ncbi:MAG: hypothetical protein R3F30_01530 [Planctomycetota bacterium]
MRPILPIALCLLAGPALAQATSYTVPYGLDSTPGNNAFSHWSGGRVLQVVDMSNRTPRALNQIAFRRYQSTSTGATSGALDVIVTMAQCDWAVVDTVFKNNWQTNVVEVLNAKSVSIPDWTVAPNPAPAPFDMVFKFSKTWVYRGNSALVWTVDYSNSTANGRSMDRDYGTWNYVGGTSLGTGCGSYGDYLQFWNLGSASPISGFHLQVAGTNGPATAPTFLLLDGSDSNLTVPGLCAKLHALPTFIFYLGASDASGTLSHRYLTLPFLAGAQNATIYTQLLAVDTTQTGLPFAVSGGQKVTIPSNTSTYGHPSCYLWAPGGGATVATGNFVFFSGAPIAELK